MRSLFTLALLTSIAAASQAAILVNGDFEAGATGFTSGYTMRSDLHTETSYNVGTNPQAYHELWASFGDHTSGAGKMLIVNGATAANAEFWGQDVSLAAGSYVFSLWGASSYAASPANVSVTLAGSSIGTTGAFSTTTGSFSHDLIPFSISKAGTYHLGMVDNNLDASGNDFVVDDLSVQAVPEPSAFAALGLGALGLLRRRTKRA